MAANKIYAVVKDGEMLKELKTLAAAKKLADEEGAQVLCEGECVYQGTVEGSEETVEGTVTETVAEKHTADIPAPEKYSLTAKMNIRNAPSLDAEKSGIAQKGDVVEVASIENDWLHLTDGTFIFYGDGRFARKS